MADPPILLLVRKPGTNIFPVPPPRAYRGRTLAVICAVFDMAAAVLNTTSCSVMKTGA